eukprot:scaffold993_cov393-Prasinococcus_capsulatus_cf.AAC.17
MGVWGPEGTTYQVDTHKTAAPYMKPMLAKRRAWPSCGLAQRKVGARKALHAQASESEWLAGLVRRLRLPDSYWPRLPDTPVPVAESPCWFRLGGGSLDLNVYWPTANVARKTTAAPPHKNPVVEAYRRANSLDEAMHWDELAAGAQAHPCRRHSRQRLSRPGHFDAATTRRCGRPVREGRAALSSMHIVVVVRAGGARIAPTSRNRVSRGRLRALPTARFKPPGQVRAPPTRGCLGETLGQTQIGNNPNNTI